MTDFNLPKRIRSRNYWFHFALDAEPKMCAACNQMGVAADMVMVLNPAHTANIYHIGCVPPRQEQK